MNKTFSRNIGHIHRNGIAVLYLLSLGNIKVFSKIFVPFVFTSDGLKLLLLCMLASSCYFLTRILDNFVNIK